MPVAGVRTQRGHGFPVRDIETDIIFTGIGPTFLHNSLCFPLIERLFARRKYTHIHTPVSNACTCNNNKSWIYIHPCLANDTRVEPCSRCGRSVLLKFNIVRENTGRLIWNFYDNSVEINLIWTKGMKI